MRFSRRLFGFGVAMVLLSVVILVPKWSVSAAESLIDTQQPSGALSHLSRDIWLDNAQSPSALTQPGPTIEAYIRPEFAREMIQLRPTILAAARRHNRPQLSGMSDEEFASVIALLLYNENFGSLEERVVPLRALTPFYQDLQTKVNETGADLSVWPANLRPSVALEIVRHQLPTPSGMQTVPVTITGSHFNLRAYHSQQDLYAALNTEISQPAMAVEYLAANLERGLYRAKIEDVPVTWRTLAAWHNQGIVNGRDIRNNPTANDYVRRAASYLPAAHMLIAMPVNCQYSRCAAGVIDELGENGDW